MAPLVTSWPVVPRITSPTSLIAQGLAVYSWKSIALLPLDTAPRSSNLPSQAVYRARSDVSISTRWGRWRQTFVRSRDTSCHQPAPRSDVHGIHASRQASRLCPLLQLISLFSTHL